MVIAMQMSNLGGPYTGWSPKQTVLNYKDGEQANTRSILRNGWNTAYATGIYNGHKRVIGPFRAVNNAGDFLSRKDYSCGGPDPQSSSAPGWSQSLMFMGSRKDNCDTTGVPASSCNPKYVYDSSDYITFRRQQATNRNYNDYKNGGDEHNGSYVASMAVRR